ncbi:MAG: hypothetical protein QOI39_4316 [Mycobacterium sp.]|jgi:hypothetical protein|nr:hypothetical protein [Mycobacterium sp.]
MRQTPKHPKTAFEVIASVVLSTLLYACASSSTVRPGSTPAAARPATALPVSRPIAAPPFPVVSVAWIGQAADGVTEAPAGVDPAAVVTITNDTAAPIVIGYDLFAVASDPGGKRAPSRPLLYSTFSTGVWDWQQANPGNPATLTVSAGASSQLSLAWSRVRQNGSVVASGQYFLLLPYTVNGAPAGYAETTYVLS